MNAAKLRHRIALRSMQVTKSATGANIATPVEIASVWAAIEPVGGREAFRSGRETADLTHDVTIRYRAEVTAANQVLHGERVFDVMRVIDVLERHRWMRLECREQRTAATP